METRKYNSLEPVLSIINSNFISLPESNVKRNNKILNSIVGQLQKKMSEKDKLFSNMFQRVFYGGSFYDGVRVGEPAEFDLHLLLKIPTNTMPQLIISNVPGFVHLQLKNYDNFMKTPEAQRYPNMAKLFDKKNFFSTQKVLSWMTSVLTKALNDFPLNADDTRSIKTEEGTFYIKYSNHGPALTLNVVSRTIPDFNIDIDLVGCFVFGATMWPKNGFTSNPVKDKPEFYIVPKGPKDKGDNCKERYWRLSFQAQERVLMDSKRTLKPTLKLIKKMRDTLGHDPIKSYYLKNMILWVLKKREDSFWNNSLSYVFMEVLKEYQQMMASFNIPYYWYSKENLLATIHGDNLVNISNKLKNAINDIEKNIDTNPKTVAKYLLTSRQYALFNEKCR